MAKLITFLLAASISLSALAQEQKVLQKAEIEDLATGKKSGISFALGIKQRFATIFEKTGIYLPIISPTMPVIVALGRSTIKANYVSSGAVHQETFVPQYSRTAKS